MPAPPKSTDRRSAILDRLADHVLAQGLAGASLRPLAKAAQLSDRMLLYYFKDKAEIIVAVLERIAERLTLRMAAEVTTPLPLAALQPRLIGVLFADALWPYMRIWLEIAALAAHGDPLYRETGARIGRGFLAWGAAQLDSATPGQREAEAARLLVTIEGMLLLRSVGLDDVGQRAL